MDGMGGYRGCARSERPSSIDHSSRGSMSMTASKDDPNGLPPILRGKNHQAPSVFAPDALLREARRQKGIGTGTVPEICILDPDGDIVRYLLATDRARRFPSWACYH